MKFQIIEEDFMGNGIFRGTELYGISGEWHYFEDWDYETGGIHFKELFTSYRKASEFLMERGYEPYVQESLLVRGQYELEFYRETKNESWSVEIIKMEVVK